MLEDYAEKNSFTGIRHFTNDGILGTAFERERLQTMLAEVEKGTIGTIIVKDMSCGTEREPTAQGKYDR